MHIKLLKRALAITLIFISLISFTCLSVDVERNGGIALIGGGYCEEAIQWMLDKTKHRKILVLSYDDNQMRWLPLLQGKAIIDFLSVGTREAANSTDVINKIKSAESILISGGNQDDYVRTWKGTKLAEAISMMALKIPVGGVSAGLAILGEYYYSAENGTVTSSEALLDPYNKYMSNIGNSFLNIPFMRNIIPDSHYGERDRYGRHLAFMARILHDNNIDNIKGIGIDSRTALCIDQSGNATVVGSGNCYLIKTISAPNVCTENEHLTWNKAVQVFVLPPSATFNISSWDFEQSETWEINEGELVRN